MATLKNFEFKVGIMGPWMCVCGGGGGGVSMSHIQF